MHCMWMQRQIWEGSKRREGQVKSRSLRVQQLEYIGNLLLHVCGSPFQKGCCESLTMWPLDGQSSSTSISEGVAEEQAGSTNIGYSDANFLMSAIWVCAGKEGYGLTMEARFAGSTECRPQKHDHFIILCALCVRARARVCVCVCVCFCVYVCMCFTAFKVLFYIPNLTFSDSSRRNVLKVARSYPSLCLIDGGKCPPNISWRSPTIQFIAQPFAQQRCTTSFRLGLRRIGYRHHRSWCRQDGCSVSWQRLRLKETQREQ